MNILSYVKPLFSSILTPDWTVYENVKYGPKERNIVDIYSLNTEESRPLLILIHGGGWQAGNEDGYRGMAKKYALAGFHVAAITYTFADEYPENQWPAQYNDVVAAMNFLLYDWRNWKVDNSRIVISGGSAGGHLSLMVSNILSRSIRPRVVYNMCGPSDMTTPQMGNLLKDLWLFGKKPYDSSTKDLYVSASPVLSMNETRMPCPIISVHGRNDEVIDFEQSERLHNWLDFLGVQNKLIAHNGTHDYYQLWKIQQWWIDNRVMWWILGKL